VDFIPLKEEDISADRAFLKGETLDAVPPSVTDIAPAPGMDQPVLI